MVPCRNKYDHRKQEKSRNRDHGLVESIPGIGFLAISETIANLVGPKTFKANERPVEIIEIMLPDLTDRIQRD